MKTSESLSKIAPALLGAQKAISYAIKDSVNPHFRNRYADLSAVIEAIKDPLNKEGLTFLQTPSPSENGTLHLTTRILHNSGEWIEDTAVCPLPKNDPQGFGSAMTYLRRYSLGAFLGVPSEDDDDGEAAVGRPVEKLPPRPAPAAKQALKPDSAKQLKFLASTPKGQALLDKVFAKYELATIDEMDEALAQKTIQWVEEELKKATT